MSKLLSCFMCCLFLLFAGLPVFVARAGHLTIKGYSMHDVHSWPGSKCTACHQTPGPQLETALLVNTDLSRLCESCHSGMITILPDNKLSSSNADSKMNNHPIKFSPLDFDPEKINHKIIKEGPYYYVSGLTGKVPLFGETMQSAVAECSTCHEPHGKLKLPKLARIKNSRGELCRVCHIDMQP